MRLLASEIIPIAQTTGFDTGMVEKVIHLFNILNLISENSFLKNQFVLKGGSALNLFHYNLPRLSIDIDLNYVGEFDRSKMIEKRPKVEQIFQAILSRENYVIKRNTREHAGGKWRIQYVNYSGQTSNLEIDINYMFREPLWNAQTFTSFKLGTYSVNSFQILNINELAAGKMAAMFSRHQARDLFDVYKLLTCSELNEQCLRPAFVVYGAFNRKDWRKISLKDIDFDPKEIQRTLSPVLQKQALPEGTTILNLAKQMIKICREKISIVFPFSKHEMLFLDKILAKGIIEPSLVTDHITLQNKIMRHPLLQWKTKNVRSYFKI